MKSFAIWALWLGGCKSAPVDSDTDPPPDTAAASGDTGDQDCEDDGFEPNDEPGLASSAVAGSELVACESSPDFWVFDVPVGSALALEVNLEPELGNIDIDLLDAAGSTLDISWGADADVERVRWFNDRNVGATVYAQVYLFFGEGEGVTYDFSSQVSPCGPDESEPDNSIFTASSPTALPRTLTTDDQDLVRLTVPAAASIEIEARFDARDGDIDLELLDGAGTSIGTSDGLGEVARLVHYNSTESEQDVYVRVYARPSETFGCLDYELETLIAPVVCEVDSLEPNNAPLEAVPLIDADLSVSIGDPDWFTLDVPAGRQVVVSASFDPADIELELELGDAANEPVSTTNPAVFFNPSADAVTAYLGAWVSPVGPGVCGAYSVETIEVDCQGDDAFEPNPDIGAAASLVDGAGLVLVPEDEDYFRLGTVPAGGMVRNTLVFTGIDADIDTQLLGASGEVLVEAATLESTEVLEWENPTAAEQDVYLRVSFWNQAYDACASQYSFTTTIDR